MVSALAICLYDATKSCPRPSAGPNVPDPPPRPGSSAQFRPVVLPALPGRPGSSSGAAAPPGSARSPGSRGPRSGIIFFRKDARDFETRINNAVFPALQARARAPARDRRARGARRALARSRSVRRQRDPSRSFPRSSARAARARAAFVSVQGGPHEHQIAGVAVQLAEVQTPAFKE